jgi:hypothetical protein
MKHRAYSVLGLMLLVAACSSGATTKGSTGGPSVEPDAGDEPPPKKPDPMPTVMPDAAAGPMDNPPPPVTPDASSGGAPEDTAPPMTTPEDAGSKPTNTGGGPGNGTYSCTLVIGIQATQQWFDAGFEKLVDGSKWELEAVHSGFIQDWADPNGSFWNMSPSSACTTNAKTPDRVIQVALWLHWMPATVDEWVKALTQVVENWKAKNPNLKRLELATFVRSPGMMPCPAAMAFKSYIRPEQDMAYDMVAAKYPGLVYVAPKWTVSSCADFGGNPPHFSAAGAMKAAQQIADYYNGKTMP